jgi:TetR/AcrR family transcriptional repressor of nem operon
MPRQSTARERLVRTAQNLFYANGYEAVGVNEICEQAEVHKGSFYHFFASKHELALAAIDEAWADFELRLLRPTFDNDRPPLEQICGVFEFAYENQRRVKERAGRALGCRFGNLAQELSVLDQPVRERLERLFLDWGAYIEGALERAVELGQVALETDAGASSRALIAYLEGLLLLAKTHDDPEVVRRLTPDSDRLEAFLVIRQPAEREDPHHKEP